MVQKRFKRIYIPYELFLVLLAVVYITMGLTFNVTNWLTCLLGVQGAVVGVLGADHTWFISVILLCYLITPIISRLWSKLANESNFKKTLLIITLFFGKAIFAFLPHSSFSTILSPLCFYSIAYFLGREFKGINIDLKTIIISLCIIFISFITRIATKFICDGTILYDRIIVGYTQIIASAALFVIFIWLFKNSKPNKLVEFINSISFEIYLCHYMFVVGPVSLMHITHNLFINGLITTVVSIIIALFLHKASDKIILKLK